MPDLNGFTMPEALALDEASATDQYGKFVAEPWEKGFGHTLGNALRRILLSSLGGVAVTSVRIEGVAHEFAAMPDVLEDVTDIILSIKKLRFRCDGDLPRTLELYADKAGPITAASIREDGVTTVLNPDAVLCTLDQDRPIRMEIEIDSGRGYRPAEENKREDQPIGVIPIDCIFSPVERVRYDVQACRVGQRTDYDRLELEIWTDGRMSPDEALRHAAGILQDHLNVFVHVAESETQEELALSADDQDMLDKMCETVKDLELSVRARNCLHNANITYIGELIQKSESEMLKYRNFGKKSLQEISEKLEGMGLDFGMEISENVKKAFEGRTQQEEEE